MNEGNATSYTGLSYRMGVDIGSITAKVVVFDLQNQMIFSDYRRHRAEIQATICSVFEEAIHSLGDIPVFPMITGSAGMGFSERYKFPFIQEVIASTEVVRRLYPEVHTVVDIGGEDTKMIFFEGNGAPDIRMNGSCAGGTGAYIDEMATLLNISIDELNALAEHHTRIYPMASRCGVFGKTDVQNLLSRAVSRPDIAASILSAVVLQVLATLARGLETRPLYLFCGGPLTFIPALRTAFRSELGLRPEEVIEAPHMELLPAMGAAMVDEDRGCCYRISELIELLSAQSEGDSLAKNRLQPLFTGEVEWRCWENNRSRHRIERASMQQVEGEPCFLGVDSGSTTSKVVLIDKIGGVVFSYCSNNDGNAIRAVQKGMQKLRKEMADCEHPPIIARSVATGYGEDLIRTAFGLHEGIVETLAHYRGAKAFEPQVTFILDIGGQDMKAIFVRDGYIYNIEINEACSSGCGTFIETFARTMGYSVGDFAQSACHASAPCDLGTRCTVFMNSRIKQALREAAEISDISAGLAYSVIKNALYKVLRVSDNLSLGEHIVVQGGTFRNPAVQRALEILLGREVICPDIPELMGAYGAALTARDVWRRNGREMEPYSGLETLESATQYDQRMIQCRGCENRCSITKLIFPNGGVFFTGNRCERIYTNHGKQFVEGTSLTQRKLELLFDRSSEPAGEPSLIIGIPRVMNIYEDFPFWNTLLVESGFRVQLSGISTQSILKKGASAVMSENICFPAKLAHGHIQDLVEKKVDRIFYPMVFAEQNEFRDAYNSFNCPVVTGYPDVVRNANDPAGESGIPLDTPAVTFRDEELLKRACHRYLRKLGVSSRRINHALERAKAAQHEYKAAVQAAAEEILEKAREDGRLVILLLGRPYHLDPLINHGIPQILVDLGVDVITEDGLPVAADATLNNDNVPTQWESVNRFYYAANWVGTQPGVEVVQLNSFACGPDAYTLDEVKRILLSHGKSYTTIRIDEIESTGSTRLRLRSLVETLKANERMQPAPKPRKTVRLFEAEDRKKVILAPYYSRFISPVVAGPLLQMGYKVETLPPSDRQSVELGLKYAPNEICYPGIIYIGDLVKALQSGKYDLNDIAIGSWQTGGQCRATSILPCVKQALIALDLTYIPIIALTTTGKLHKQPGFDLNYLEYIPKAIRAIIYEDALSAMYHATAIREVNHGETLALADELLEPLKTGNMSFDQDSVLRRLRDAIARFNKIDTHQGEYPKVGIVGEIYHKYHSFSNHYVARWLMSQGVEVLLPSLLEFFMGWFVSTSVRAKENLTHKDLVWCLAKIVEWRVQNVIDDAEEIMHSFKLYRPGHSIHDVAREAEKIVTLTHGYGEGWLIAGEIGMLAEHGVPNVLCLQPFGCIANQVVAHGAVKRLKKEYKNLNLLLLDLDASTSEVNYFNRLHFFVKQAKDAMCEG